MKVSIFGLGYVGCVSVACLSRLRHHVIGVDIVQAKVDLIDAGVATVVEPEVDALMSEGFQDGRISATTDARQAVLDSDVSLICVGTPSNRAGEHDLTAVEATADAIGKALVEKTSSHLVVIRSTLIPGTIEKNLLARLVRMDNPNKGRISVVIIPEFLSEGSAVRDYYDPPLIVVGTLGGKADLAQGAIAAIMSVDPEKILWVQYQQAEMLKALCNAFHAMKVAFANEVGALCDEAGIDGRSVMSLLTLDRKLNISPAYLRPGLPYGGSCLPKDLSAVVAMAERNYVSVPLLSGIIASNEAHKQRMQVAVTKVNGYRRIAMDGLAFKSGTDDLRESPLVEIAEYLLGKGYDLKIYDPAVSTARLTGANQHYIEERIPHLASRLVADVEDMFEHAEVLILTRDDNELFDRAAMRENPPQVIDLTGAGRHIERAAGKHEVIMAG